MRSRTWRAIALLLSLLLILAACGADDEPPVADPEPTPTDDELPPDDDNGDLVRADADLVIWADETRRPVIEPFAEAFGEEHGVSVAVQEIDFGAMRDRVRVAGPVGEGPDIFIGAHDWLGEMVADGIVDAVDLAGAEGDFLDVAIRAVTFDGAIYGVPYAVENVALLRNADLAPDSHATFADLRSHALALLEAGDVEIGLAMPWADPYHEYPFFSAHGGYVFAVDADGTYDPSDVGIDSDGGLGAARFYAQQIADGLINPDVNHDIMVDAFSNGQTAYAIAGPWTIGDFRAADVNYVVEPIPPVNGGEPGPFVGVQAFFISAFAENPLLAQTFVLDMMASEEAQLELFEAGARPPALSSAFEAASADPDVQGFGEAAEHGVPMPAIPEMAAVWSAFADAYALIGEGGDAEQAFRDAAEQIRTAIQ